MPKTIDQLDQEAADRAHALNAAETAERQARLEKHMERSRQWWQSQHKEYVRVMGAAHARRQAVQLLASLPWPANLAASAQYANEMLAERRKRESRS